MDSKKSEIFIETSALFDAENKVAHMANETLKKL